MKRIIRKIVYKNIKNSMYQSAAQYISEQNYLLALVKESFDGPYFDFISSDMRNNTVFIWNDLDERHYASIDTVPKFTLTDDNYSQVGKQWDDNAINPAPYLILTQDEDGFVNLEQKQTLSQEDLNFIASEKLKLEQDKTIPDVFKNNINND
ncbi:hypothetical protein HYV11_02725 [Candidatus Dependentiae bacterium]|nr:hypothetical protein [Candidatus Dependentiae bacterium]